jgi:hypothetical protein
MTEAATAEAPRARNSVALPANSFELSELDKALTRASEHKDEDKRPGLIDKAVRSSAKFGDVLDAQEAAPIPEGSELKKITTQHGQEVEAAVSIPADAKSGEEAAAIEPEPVQAAAAASERAER